jgi:WD40 repeat protein
MTLARSCFYDLKGASPREVARWTDLPGIRDLSFDPRGERLAVSSQREAVAEIRETATGRVLQKLAHPAPVTGVGWHPSRNELATGSEDYRVRIWDARSGELLHLLAGHQNVSVRPVYHPAGGILATAGWDAVLRFWASNTGNLLFNGPACYDWQRFRLMDRA